MPCITKYRNGWRAQICISGKRESSTFDTRREAELWAHKAEQKLRQQAETNKLLRERFGVRDKDDSKCDIIDKQHHISNVPGIYVLFNDGIVSYVGKSMNMISRIASHAEKGRKFTHFYTIPTLPDELDVKEVYYVNMLDPYENRALKIGGFRDKKLQADVFKIAEEMARVTLRNEKKKQEEEALQIAEQITGDL